MKTKEQKKVISKSKKRIGLNKEGERCHTEMVVTLIEDGRKMNGKKKYYSYTRHEAI